MTTVIHAHEDDRHAVAVDALRVLIVQDGAQWFARGIEIDYAASGTSVEDVQRRFARGFGLTITSHLRKFHSVEKLLKWAPSDVIREYEEHKECYEFTQISLHEIPELEIDDGLPMIPFDVLKFAYREHAAAP
jgi:hypothetical protein